MLCGHLHTRFRWRQNQHPPNMIPSITGILPPDPAPLVYAKLVVELSAEDRYEAEAQVWNCYTCVQGLE